MSPINSHKSAHHHGRFLDPLRIEMDPRLPKEDRTWTLTDRLRYIDSRGQEHWIPLAFSTDGATIPWFLWRVVGHPMETDYVAAAVVHDFLWRMAKDGALPFRQANWVFRDALLSTGMPILPCKAGRVRTAIWAIRCVLWWLRCWIMWLGVTINAARIQLLPWPGRGE